MLGVDLAARRQHELTGRSRTFISTHQHRVEFLRARRQLAARGVALTPAVVVARARDQRRRRHARADGRAPCKRPPPWLAH